MRGGRRGGWTFLEVVGRTVGGGAGPRPPLKLFSLPECCGIFSAMSRSHFILHEKEYNEFQSVLKKLLTDSYAKVVFLVDKNGSLLSSTGETAGFDTTSLASLAAGNIAATGGLASLIGEKEFSILFHEGERDNMHISVIENRLILVVIFDRRSSVGLVRLRVRRAGEELGRILKSVDETARREEGGGGVIEELTEADIESLFK